MRSTLARLLVGTLVGAAAILAGAPAAFAHGDPSSHYLEQDVLYPAVADRPTPETELRLLGLLYAARDNGYPIKVALIANAQDLLDPSMLNRPQNYADYVAGELSRIGPLRGPVLVVTPTGYGLAGNVPGAGDLQPLSRDQSNTLVGGLAPVAGEGGEALAVLAIAATRRLAADAGHPLPAYVPPAQPLQATAPAAQPSEPGGWNPWLALGVFGGVFLFAVLAYEAQRRFAGAAPSGETAENDVRAIASSPAEPAGAPR